MPASCTARLDLQRHYRWFVTSELSVAPLVFPDLCMHPGQERPPCSELERVLAQSVFVFFFCFLYSSKVY